jgi:hypothetical protein
MDAPHMFNLKVSLCVVTRSTNMVCDLMFPTDRTLDHPNRCPPHLRFATDCSECPLEQTMQTKSKLAENIGCQSKYSQQLARINSAFSLQVTALQDKDMVVQGASPDIMPPTAARICSLVEEQVTSSLQKSLPSILKEALANSALMSAPPSTDDQNINDQESKASTKPVSRLDRFYSSTKECVLSDPVLEVIKTAFSKQLSKDVWSDLMEKYTLLDMVRTLLRPADYLMKLDLQDAYFMVPIHEQHKKYLRLAFEGRTYEFQSLPFGLSSAPRAFTKLLKPVVAVLRSSGIRIVIYLDDILVMHQSAMELVNIFNMVLTLLRNLGFLVKMEKCSLHPTQELVFLGALLNSKTMTIAVPPEKLTHLQKECTSVALRDVCSMHELAVIIGRMNQKDE